VTVAVRDMATLIQRIAEAQGGGSGGGGAPTTATYVTLSTDATLTAERVLTAGNAIDITDGGAGAAVTIDVDENELAAPIPALVAGTWTGATSITTVGTIGTGAWQGTPVAAAYLGSHTHAASDITSGTMATARLGSGSASASTFLDGANTWRTLTAADVDAAYPKASTTTFSLPSSTTMTSACAISGIAAGTYKIDGLVAYVSPTGAGIKIQVEVSSGTGTVSWWVTDRDSGALAAWSSSSTPNYSSATGSTLRATLAGVLRVTGAPVTLTLKLAQNSSNVTATTAEARIQLLPF